MKEIRIIYLFLKINHVQSSTADVSVALVPAHTLQGLQKSDRERCPSNMHFNSPGFL